MIGDVTSVTPPTVEATLSSTKPAVVTFAATTESIHLLLHVKSIIHAATHESGIQAAHLCHVLT